MSTLKRDLWFHREGSSTPRARLVCLPPAGAGAQFFRGWGASLPDDVELLAVRLPGREGRVKERALHRMQDVLPGLYRAIIANADVPFAYYGHSMGSLFAVVLAEHARDQDDPAPRGLVVSGRRPPHVDTDRRPMHTLDDDALWNYLRDIGGLHPRVWKEADLKPVLLPPVRADLTLVEQHVYDASAAPLDLPIHVLSADSDPLIEQGQMERWSERTTREVVMTSVPGAHFFMNDDADAFHAALRSAVDRLLV